jgi:hypothetical protein
VLQQWCDGTELSTNKMAIVPHTRKSGLRGPKESTFSGMYLHFVQSAGLLNASAKSVCKRPEIVKVQGHCGAHPNIPKTTH